jgi:CBS domain-containing protein/sporulation protein YlmC with PRC-barrel domain
MVRFGQLGESTMNNPPNNVPAKPLGFEAFQLLYFSTLLNRRVRLDKSNRKNGRLTDLVFRLSEPYPEAVGIYIEHGKGHPTELIPWEKVVRIEDEALFITPSESGQPYPAFVDQKGWILLNEHLMGQTILDIDGRRTEVVNDVHLLFSKGRMILVHVDISFNGFLRKWGLERFATAKDQLISWRYVQPLSVEDHTKDIVTLSVAREQALELPSEDLADALEVLSGDEQQAMFSALDPGKAAEVLGDAEPRAKRQLIAFLSEEKARQVLAIMSLLQIADFLSSLPHAKAAELIKLLPPARAARVNAIMSNTDVPAATLMSEKFFAFTPDAKAVDVLHSFRNFIGDNRNISYLYIVAGEVRTLLGVVDLRDLVVAPENATLGQLMTSPVVSADRDCLREDLVALFAKYQFHILPVVDVQDRLLGIVRNRDIMKGTKFEPKAD